MMAEIPHTTELRQQQDAAHIPDGCVYGPVHSRRFGRSLSVAGRVTCSWNCPYCQLGGGDQRFDPEAYIRIHDLRTALHSSLVKYAENCDVLTIAGAGEPLQHPDIAAVLPLVAGMSRRCNLPSILLTNGDGLRDPDVR